MAMGKSLTGTPEVPRLAPGVSPSRLIELVDSRRKDSVEYNRTLFNGLQDRYDTYRGHWRGNVSQFRNNLSIPFTFSMIQSDVARKVQTLFGSWPIVTFEGAAPEDHARAKKNEVLISAQMKDCGTVQKSCDFFLQDDICGTAILRYGWKNVVRPTRIRQMEQVAPGFSIPVVRETDGQVFNGPTWEVVDRLDFWQQPAKKYIDDMGWVIHRYWKDWDDLMDDAQYSDYPYFDKGAIQELRDYPIHNSQAQEYNARRLTFRNEYDYMARQRERFAKPVEIWEMHGLVPREFAPDGYRHRCIAIGNGKVVMKNRPGPMPDQSKPFIAFSSQPDPYGFDGIAKAEIAGKPQKIADRLANQKLDALDLLIDPMWVMNSQFNNNTQNLFTRAGRIFLTDGPADDSNIRPLSPDMRGFQAAYGEVSTLYQYMQLGMGMNDILLGQSEGGGRETARGVLARQENAIGRLNLETTLANEQMVQPLADAFRKLDRMFLPLPQEIKILGSLAQTDPITGLPYAPLRVSVDYDDLAPDYRAKAVGASQMLGKNIRQQNVMTLLQIVGSNPALLQLINWPNFTRQVMELFDFQNVDQLMIQNQMPAFNQMLTGPGQGGPPGGNSMSQMDPAILGAMTGQQNGAPIPAQA